MKKQGRWGNKRGWEIPGDDQDKSCTDGRGVCIKARQAFLAWGRRKEEEEIWVTQCVAKSTLWLPQHEKKNAGWDSWFVEENGSNKATMGLIHVICSCSCLVFFSLFLNSQAHNF